MRRREGRLGRKMLRRKEWEEGEEGEEEEEGEDVKKEGRGGC
jgi:hypothetical protein